MNANRLQKELDATTAELDRYIELTRILWDLHRAVVESSIQMLEDGDAAELLETFRGELATVDDIDNTETAHQVAAHIGWGVPK